MQIRKTAKAATLILLLALGMGGVIWAANQHQAATSDKLRVAATFYPLYEFAKQVGGDKIDAANITPAGSEPHDFEPSPQTLARAYDATVFIYNGGTFEPWVDKFLPDYQGTAVKASDHIALQQGDPHYWLDPVLAAQAVRNIRDALVKASPQDSSFFAHNADAYIAKLQKLNSDIASSLASCAARTIVSSHEAFGYFARRYNLALTPIAGLSSDQEPSASKLAELTKLVHNQGITYIFYERLVSPRLADTIANETGAKTAVLDPLEGLTNEDQQQGHDYVSVQRDNLRNLRAALACK